MIKLYKRLEKYWGTEGEVGQTIWLTLFSLTAGSLIAVLIYKTVLAAVSSPGYMDYDKVFKEDAPKTVIAQDNLGELYQVNLKKGTSQTLGVNADILVSDDANGKNYALKVLDNQLDIEVLKGAKRKNSFSIEFTVSDKENLEVKIAGSSLFLFETKTKQFAQVDLEKQMIVKEHNIEMASEIIDWAVSTTKLFLATPGTFTVIDLETMLQEKEIEYEGINKFSIDKGILTIFEEPNELGFLTQFDADTLEFVDSIAFEANEAGLIESSSSEPYIYFYTLNPQGGISVEVLDVKKSTEYLVNLNLKKVKHELHFVKGYAYYVNEEDEGVVLSPKSKEVLFELSDGVKKIIPVY